VDVVWTGTRLVVAGPATRAVVPDASQSEVKLGVRFRVGAAALALGLPADELRDRFVPLEDLWPDGDELERRVGEAPGAAARMRQLSKAMESRLREVPAPDGLVREAVHDLAAPRARVALVGRRLAISERQLRRRVERSIGYSPRTLARILRLQRFLALARRHPEDLAALAFKAGYADQAHLTRDCNALAGLPAAALLAAGAAPAGERLER
jgi:AraC-like DNA-binding protein